MSQQKVPFAYHSNPRTEATWYRYRCLPGAINGRNGEVLETWGEMWDEYGRETFTLKAIIFVTINDYLALFYLSGQKKRKNRLCSLFEW
jgi:hypothetical protein